MAWSPDGLLAVELDGSLEFWDMRIPKMVGALALPVGHSPLNCMAWSPDGLTLACGMVGQLGFISWRIRVNEGGRIEASPPHRAAPAAVLDIAWQSGSAWIATASRDGAIYIGAPLPPGPGCHQARRAHGRCDGVALPA